MHSTFSKTDISSFGLGMILRPVFVLLSIVLEILYIVLDNLGFIVLRVLLFLKRANELKRKEDIMLKWSDNQPHHGQRKSCYVSIWLKELTILLLLLISILPWYSASGWPFGNEQCIVCDHCGSQ